MFAWPTCCRNRLDHGEFAHAHAAGLIGPGGLRRAWRGSVGHFTGSPSADDITIADLTGVATQDIAMARTRSGTGQRGCGNDRNHHRLCRKVRAGPPPHPPAYL
jgi:hypothetical protein